jgi:hypothetical protein
MIPDTQQHCDFRHRSKHLVTMSAMAPADSANCGGSLDFDSSPVVTVSAEQAKHVGDEENQQYCPQPYAGPTPRTPAGMAVVPSTEAKNQY